MLYYKAWYQNERDGEPVDDRFPDWVVYAADEDDAARRVLERIERTAPERGFRIFLRPITDEDEATVAFASARQSGQAID